MTAPTDDELRSHIKTSCADDWSVKIAVELLALRKEAEKLRAENERLRGEREATRLALRAINLQVQWFEGEDFLVSVSDSLLHKRHAHVLEGAVMVQP